jgi:hypothetical protein
MLKAIMGAAVVLMLLGGPAAAHHRYHHHHRFHHSVAASAWRADYGEPRRDLASVAMRFVGGGNPTGFRGPWCAAFANMIMDRLGIRHVASRRAIDALHDGWRVANPARGDLAVMRHHVTIFVGWGGRGFVAVGGNQGHHRVTLSSYPVRRVIAWVRPG